MMGQISLVLFGSFFLLLLIGAPIYLALGASSILTISVFQLDPLAVLPSIVQGSTASFTLLAIPLFILAGNLLGGAELTKRLVDLARTIVGDMPGGLAVVSVAVGIFFAGISGSGAADTAAIGAIMIPSMIQDGYDKGFAAALVAADGAIGIIIPPSIGLIIYGVVANVSIGDLFIAGVIPGIVVGLCLAAVSVLTARRKGWGRSRGPGHDLSANDGSAARAGKSDSGSIAAHGDLPGQPATAPARGVLTATQPTATPKRRFDRLIAMAVATRRAGWGLLAPIIILGGIYGGIFTPTESAGVVVVYALFTGLVIYRDLTFTRILKVVVQSARTTGVVMIILATATLFALILNTQGIAAQITSALTTSGLGKFGTLLVIDVLLIVAGAFLDVIGTYYILLPILLPVVLPLGIDPVHFGIITTVALAISLTLPPVGLNLYVASAIADVPVGRIVRSLAPVFAAEFAALLLITYIPGLSLGLPHLLGS